MKTVGLQVFSAGPQEKLRNKVGLAQNWWCKKGNWFTPFLTHSIYLGIKQNNFIVKS